MSQFGDMMRRARRDAEEGDWSPPPGTHKAVVTEGTAYESKAGEPWAKTTLRYLGDPDDGRQWDHVMGFRSPQQAKMTAAQLSVYGVPDEVLDNLEDIDDLARHMAELAGIEIEVTCKSRNPNDPSDGVWTNITSSRGHRRDNGDVPADREGLATGAVPRSGVYDDDPPF